MRYWYAYTGNNLLFMHGRAIRRVISVPQIVQPFLESATLHFERYAATAKQPIASAVFIAAMMAPLAAQELGAAAGEATVFSSVKQVLQLFDEAPAQRIAVNLLNGKIASAYAHAGNAEEIAAQVIDGFDSGKLLQLPRDAMRLHASENMAELPGIVAFLLAQTKAESRAFTDYLRRGGLPFISREAATSISAMRPVLRTWEREARQKHTCAKGACE